jgi:hypothetical protein
MGKEVPQCHHALASRAPASIPAMLIQSLLEKEILPADHHYFFARATDEPIGLQRNPVKAGIDIE